MIRRRQLLFVGELANCTDFLEALLADGYWIGVNQIDRIEQDNHDLLIARVNETHDLSLFEHHKSPWLAWCMNDSPIFKTRTYQMGAMVAFDKETPIPTILQIITRTLANGKNRQDTVQESAVHRRYSRGDIILLESETILEIQNGIIAQTMIYLDGAEVLLGLYGPGQMLLPHPADTCYLQLVAHTDCVVMLKPWALAAQEPNLPVKIRSRLQQMEAWAAIQARPNLDQRILGIFSLLAEQFGRSSHQGKVVDVKITHMQLAAAVGATRTTITRVLGDLRRQGIISTIETKDGERYCLTQWEQSNHGLSQEINFGAAGDETHIKIV